MEHEGVRTWWPIIAFVLLTIVQAVLVFARVKSLEDGRDRFETAVKDKVKDLEKAFAERVKELDQTIAERLDRIEDEGEDELEETKQIRKEGFHRIERLEQRVAVTIDRVERLMKRVFNGHRHDGP